MNKYLVSLGFILTLLFLSLTAVAKEAPEEDYKPVILQPTAEIQEMYDKLHSHSGLTLKRPLLIESTKIFNAGTNGAVVYVYVGMLNFTIRDRTPDMLAYVLAHEISHIVFQDPYSGECNTSPMASRNCERRADWNAIKIMTDAGYNCEDAAVFYADQIKRWGNHYSDTSTHPADSEREVNVKKTCAVYKATGKLDKLPVETPSKGDK